MHTAPIQGAEMGAGDSNSNIHGMNFGLKSIIIICMLFISSLASDLTQLQYTTAANVLPTRYECFPFDSVPHDFTLKNTAFLPDLATASIKPCSDPLAAQLHAQLELLGNPASCDTSQQVMTFYFRSSWLWVPPLFREFEFVFIRPISDHSGHSPIWFWLHGECLGEAPHVRHGPQLIFLESAIRHVQG